MSREWPGKSEYPCQAKPQTTKMPAATANTHSELSITCAALCERPRPVLMRARPAAAKGVRRTRTVHRIKADSLIAVVGIPVILFRARFDGLEWRARGRGFQPPTLRR